MNLSTPFGILMGIGIILMAISAEVSNSKIFFNIHSLAIVIGGTLATGLISFSFGQIRDIALVLVRQFLGQRTKIRIETINDIIQLSESVKNGESLESKVEQMKPGFLKESLELYLEGSMSKEELGEVLEKRIEVQNDRYHREGQTFKVIGKFPPAFGLIGATLGMIGLLQGLGSEDAFTKLGPAMSVALTATFWGLVVANLVLLPLGENLTLAAEEDLIIREIAVDGVMLLREKKHPLLVKEYLLSYLPPKERDKVYEVK